MFVHLIYHAKVVVPLYFSQSLNVVKLFCCLLCIVGERLRRSLALAVIYITTVDFHQGKA